MSNMPCTQGEMRQRETGLHILPDFRLRVYPRREGTAVGQLCSKDQIDGQTGFGMQPAVFEGNFTSTVHNVDQENLVMLIEFQK